MMADAGRGIDGKHRHLAKPGEGPSTRKKRNLAPPDRCETLYRSFGRHFR